MYRTGEIVVDDRPEWGCRNEEAALVRRVLAGEPSAFDLLVQRHSAQVTSVVRRVLGDPNEVEDAVQETFLRAYQSLKRFRGRAAFRTWLIQIAINVCRDRRRTFWRRRVAFSEDTRLPEPPTSGADRLPERIALQHGIAQALERLPENLRLPFVLHAFEDLSGAETAQVLGWNESTVWKRIYSARKRLQQELGYLLD